LAGRWIITGSQIGRGRVLGEMLIEAGNNRANLPALPSLATPGFIDALPGYLLPDAASEARIRTALRRLKAVVAA